MRCCIVHGLLPDTPDPTSSLNRPPIPYSTGWMRMAILVLCLKPENLLDPNDSFRRCGGL